MPETKPSDEEINAILNKAPEEIRKIVLDAIKLAKNESPAKAEERTQILIRNLCK